MAVACGFCGKTGQIDKEHVWPEWISRALAPMTVAIEFGRNTGVQRWTGRAIEMTVRAFCKSSCNNGWMSDLEFKAKPIIEPMLTGNAKALGTTDQHLLAAWVLKTVMVAEYFNADNKYFTSRERQRFMKSLRPPPDVLIWLGHYIGKEKKAHNVSTQLLFPRASDQRLVPAFSSTMTAGQLAFQVFSYRASLAESHRFHVRRAPWYTTRQWENTVLVPLWPDEPGVALIWPPRIPITDEALPVLCKRFEVAPKPPGSPSSWPLAASR